MTETQKPILLDGGMGQEIVNRGGKVAYGEWAAAALHETPELVSAIHRDYLRAGADVITTNTYGTTRTRMRHVGLEGRFAELVGLAGQLACRARDDLGASDARIAASLPPLEASYVSEFALSFEQTIGEYAELMALLEPYVDIFLGETFSTAFEARAFLTAARDADREVWLALTLDDGERTTLRGGESLADAVAEIGAEDVDALLVNCCKPATIGRALPILRAGGLPFGGYANGFVEIPASWDELGGVSQLDAAADLTPEAYARDVAGWIAAGAAIVGGCCEIGPAHIARLRQLIDSGA